MTATISIPDDWRSWSSVDKLRFRWRLLTDLHPEEQHRRPEQLTPHHHWLCPAPFNVPDAPMDHVAHVTWEFWFLLGGRGSGKTRCGAEDVADFALRNGGVRVHLVAPTFADVRDTMYEGESGLLNVIPESLLLGSNRDRAYNRSLGELFLENGSQFKGFSSETPQRLRGPQCHRLWLEELATFKDAHLGEIEDTTLSNAMLGLRLGSDPKAVVTTTPKNNKLVRELLFENPDDLPERRRPNPNVVITRMSTYRNAHNLAPQFRARILRKYEGTRAGRQEIHAELIDDVEGALWSREVLDRCRVSVEQYAELVVQGKIRRVVTAVDPATTSNDESDDTGIVSSALSRDKCPLCSGAETPHGFIIRDDTCHLPPIGWAKRVLEAYDALEADAIVGEVNNGGDLVESNVRAVRENVPFKQVRASRGKVIRAEPVASLFGGDEIDGLTGQPTGRFIPARIHIVGHLPALEDQMCTWDPDESNDSPDRVDAAVWGIWFLMLGQLSMGGPGKIAKRANRNELNGQGTGPRVPHGMQGNRARRRKLRRQRR